LGLFLFFSEDFRGLYPLLKREFFEKIIEVKVRLKMHLLGQDKVENRPLKLCEIKNV
jgi:hypothetical protein